LILKQEGILSPEHDKFDDENLQTIVIGYGNNLISTARTKILPGVYQITGD